MYRFKTIAAVGLSGVLGAGASGQILNQDLKLLPDDGAISDQFGFSIAIADGVVAVGSPSDDDIGNASGSAYLFDASTGAQLAKLLANDGAIADFFGTAIAIGGGIVAVGVAEDDDNGFSSGSAYLFDASTGVQIAKLLPVGGDTDDRFATSVDIAGGIAAVGAPFDDDNGFNSGSAYLFDASTGAQLFKLLPDDGAALDNFGYSIAIAGGVVAVGARADDDNGFSSGSAYLFDATTGAQLFKLLPDDGTGGAFFGISIAIGGGVVAVGAPSGDGTALSSGTAYIFNASTGAQIAELLTDDGVSPDNFGFAIAIADGLVAVGASNTVDNGTASGSAYLFDASTGAQIAKLLPDDGATSDVFGISIGISGGVVAVGAWGDDDNGSNSGSAYVFATSSSCSPADLGEPFGVLDFTDIIAFLTAFGAMAPEADLALPMGVWDFSDVIAFLTAFGAGCP